MDKRSSLPLKFINHRQKDFITLTPGHLGHSRLAISLFQDLSAKCLSDKCFLTKRRGTKLSDNGTARFEKCKHLSEQPKMLILGYVW
jgi:hypothetical protein